MYRTNVERLDEKIKTFSKFGDTGNGGITRFSLSKEALDARAEFVKRMEAMGATVRYDDVANLYAEIPGSEDLPAIMMGSHLDSVRNGGNYDGVLGVLTAMEVAETIVTEKIPHRHPISVVVWTNEEGSRFDPAMMCSGIITGKFDKETMLKSKDPDGVTFGEALDASGYKGDEKDRIDFDKTKALLELHIEQGPVLEDKGLDIGVVEGVVGMVNYEFTFRGQSDHAGTTPMQYRRDALLAASHAILWLHEKLDTLPSDLVYTTGRISCHPNIHTVIPDEVKFTLDARHQDMGVLDKVVEIIKSIPKEIVGCKVSYEQLWGRNTIAFNERLVNYVEQSADELGYKSLRMYSGAGHDAQYLAEFVPTTMIFVQSRDGHSHCEEEFTPHEICSKGADVLLNTLLKVDQE